MSYLEDYLEKIVEKGNPGLAGSVKKTTDDVIPQYIRNFSYKEHVVSLLMGNVQSGKTSHMFGLINAAADEGFGIFVLLTTDNILLQQQTLSRAEKDFSDFCICGENDYLRFADNAMRKPVLIILKKNWRILKQWKNNFSSTNFCKGNPLFIVDDEADAASLNTMVNKDKKSTINKILEEIKNTSSSSIYMQVTGTPQSIFLQTVQSGWNPYFIYYFDPGQGYLGGDFFFNQEDSPYIKFTDNNEAQEILVDDEFPENGLKTALIIHLITSAHIFISAGKVSNFMIHPSVKTSQHGKFAEKVGEYLNEIMLSIDEDCMLDVIRKAYNNIKESKPTIAPFEDIYVFIRDSLENDDINVLVINSVSSYEDNVQYESGINVIIGGNSLGRGVTFPQLQTIYYCRVAKNPQADTMWQHSRMFGYDRDVDLMRVFMPPKLYKLFSDINTTNNSLIAQIKRFDETKDIKVCYPKGVQPTRKNVLDNRAISILSGGVNYFPYYPTNTNIVALDEMLAPFKDECYTVNLKFIVNLLKLIGSEADDWDTNNFIGFVNTFILENSLEQGKLIVRRERDITKGTGTLLSPNDRRLGAEFSDKVVITMYKVTGTKGWNNEKLWIPNIKLPEDIVYYNVNS
ncbi:Z1 domain-containing protein [Paenibacillus crassostreae]|uniref:Restriction endonuclease n=1 Tax=Paenibacillus crassostreae TaxID=1763538 RepID=A0A167AQ37_9BACL|nr:Z1 domain-containing protein [Paenibacillus crassostreae]AOZ93766.1 restriction endonuclease [Paenibacillus crassostreae]OAB71300.1 restriction endonuclease [Paenibacillus crassostreae]